MAKPALQELVHTLPPHEGVSFVAEQTIAHPPQLLGSLVVSSLQPFC